MTMRCLRLFTLLGLMLPLSGCRYRYTAPEQPLPANTVMLSALMRELSSQPGFMDAVLREIEGEKAPGAKKGPALMTPKLADELRKRILGRDWSGLDRFPGWSMRAINPTVDVAGHVLAKDAKLEALSAAHPGTPAMKQEPARSLLDLGSYALDRAETVSLKEPSTLPGFTTSGIVSDVGAGVVRGDGANALAPEHAESQRLADVLNRLAANGLDGAKPFAVRFGDAASPAATPEQLLHLLNSNGHTVTVQDARYFANFGHLHYKGQDVMMPFWIDSGYEVPESGNLWRRPRPLLIPVSHAELEWHVRGPKINADISFYFGIDGKAEWRTMDTLDQAWVLKRNAHTYTGEQAGEATRLAGLMVAAFMRQHARRPQLPFGGYYALGVCQDVVSVVEHRVTGAVTLFPNTADDRLFDDPRDQEINAAFAAIPKDREGKRPEPARIFGSLPTEHLEEITIPGLSDDLMRAKSAWQAGKLKPMRGEAFYELQTLVCVVVPVVMLVVLAWSLRRRS